jgi:hypothetical protein
VPKRQILSGWVAWNYNRYLAVCFSLLTPATRKLKFCTLGSGEDSSVIRWFTECVRVKTLCKFACIDALFNISTSLNLDILCDGLVTLMLHSNENYWGWRGNIET